MYDEHITISAPAHGLLPPTDTNSVWPFLSYSSSSSPPLLIFTESRLPSFLPHWHPLSYLYSLLHVHFKHSHLQTHHLLCLTPSIIYLTFALKHTHMHAHTHVYTRWCVCFCSVIFQWGVFWGWFWTGWCFCLKTSNWVIAGNRRRRRRSSSKPGKANNGWVSARRALLCFFIYVLLSLKWWS